MASTDQTGNPKPERELTPQARRALAEAEERRRLADARKAASPQPPKEIGGQDGPDDPGQMEPVDEGTVGPRRQGGTGSAGQAAGNLQGSGQR